MVDRRYADLSDESLEKEIKINHEVVKERRRLTNEAVKVLNGFVKEKLIRTIEKYYG